MEYQNPSLNFFFERTDGQTNGRTSRKQYAPHFFKVGGIKTFSKNYITTTALEWSVASKLPGGEGLKVILHCVQTFARDLGVILSTRND